MKPTPKFEIGDRVRDTVRDRIGTITAIYWDEGNQYNDAEWAYSFDVIGWYYYGESDLEKVCG